MPTSALTTVRRYHPNVNRVIDAKKDLKISVTAEDGQSAKKKAPDACALANACKRGSFDGAIVSMAVAYMVKGDTAYRYIVPQSISREIVSFDRHQDFAPGEYALKKPTKSMKLGPRKYRLNPDRHKVKYKTHKRRAHKTAGIRSL